MKAPLKAKRAPKRDLFAELSEGMTALAQVRQGKHSGIVSGSGNIYRDFDVPDADVRQLKAALAARIIKTLDKKGLSVECLMAMINGLGSRVDVAVTLRRAETRHAAAVA